MSWANWYYVSVVHIVKTLPVKVAASSEEEAIEKFREMREQGKGIEEEERTHQYIVNEKRKAY
jgi:hypothetical protein